MKPDDPISLAEFQQWERVVRAETEVAIAAFEAVGDNPHRPSPECRKAGRDVIVAAG